MFGYNWSYFEEVGISQDTMLTVGIPMGLVHGDLWTNNMLFECV